MTGLLATKAPWGVMAEVRAMLAREIAWASDHAATMARTLAPPPRTVPRVTPEPEKWHERIKKGIRVLKSRDPLEGIVESSYNGNAADGGKPAGVNLFLEFGTRAAGASKYRQYTRGQVALPSFYQHGSKLHGLAPQPFMLPAYLSTMKALKERAARGVSAAVAKGWR